MPFKRLLTWTKENSSIAQNNRSQIACSQNEGETQGDADDHFDGPYVCTFRGQFGLKGLIGLPKLSISLD
jgi:hypothetical protein